jgi:hypothetical protein
LTINRYVDNRPSVALPALRPVESTEDTEEALLDRWRHRWRSLTNTAPQSVGVPDRRSNPTEETMR